jgi:hypothetical protein
MEDSTSDTGSADVCAIDDLDNLCKILHEELNQADLHASSQLYLECHGDETNDILLGEQIEAMRQENMPRVGSHIDISTGEESVYRVSFLEPTPGTTCEPADRISCNMCSKTFTKTSMLLDHKSDVHNLSNLFPCSLCQYKGQCYRHWHKHVSRMHPRSNFTQLLDGIVSGLDETISGETGTEADTTDPSTIVQCDQVATDSQNGITQKPTLEHQCLLCSKTFPKKRSLMYHRRTHSEKTHPCSIPGCSKTFKTTSALNEHKITVHGTRVYKCTHTDCTKTYALQRDLDYHMKSHTAEFSCTICAKTFRDQHNLSQHTKIHTGQKDLKCGHCDYTCIQSSAMRSHKRRKHERKSSSTSSFPPS